MDWILAGSGQDTCWFGAGYQERAGVNTIMKVLVP